MNKHDKKYNDLYDNLLMDVDRAFGDVVDDVSRVVTVANVSAAATFTFGEHRAVLARVESALKRFERSITGSIVNSIKESWNISAAKNDEMLHGIFGGTIPKPFASHNLDALEAALSGKVNGLTLSDRIWKISAELKGELERCVNAAVVDGKSAAELSRDIRKYLRNPDALYRRIRDKNGKLGLSDSAMEYKPGRGVYRSSYQNALRLARTELNKAYRRADWLRWQQLDFVVGYRIVTSRSAGVCELCSGLEGEYPKTFYFVGWHPSCRCHCVPIYATDDLSLIESGEYSKRQPPVPGNFTDWVVKNAGRIQKSAPQFITDNMKIVKLI